MIYNFWTWHIYEVMQHSAGFILSGFHSFACRHQNEHTFIALQRIKQTLAIHNMFIHPCKVNFTVHLILLGIFCFSFWIWFGCQCTSTKLYYHTFNMDFCIAHVHHTNLLNVINVYAVKMNKLLLLSYWNTKALIVSTFSIK